MKRLFAVLMFFLMLICFVSCDSQNSPQEETQTALFENESLAYDAMINAATKGKYADALKYYNNGAAGVEDSDVINWYFYSMAMEEYAEHSCTGYTLDLLLNKVSKDFEPAKGITEQLLTAVKDFNGAYEKNGVYLYFSDGKIAISAGSQLSDTVFCSDEIVFKDEVYYFAKRAQDGSHELLYTIEKTDDGVFLSSEKDIENDLYSGAYVLISDELPQMIY